MSYHSSSNFQDIYTIQIMTSPCLDDTLPLVMTVEESDDKISELSDGEKTNHESNISISPNNKSNSGSSVKILYEVINLKDSGSKTLEVMNMKVSEICRNILLDIKDENIKNS